MERPNINPHSKRRRLVETWSTPKGYDNKPAPSMSARKCKVDPMDDLGRQHWAHSNTLPIGERPLCTGFHSGKWCFFPRNLDVSNNWEKMKTHGIAGIHYAIGYKMLGEMVIKYGSDYSNWPPLLQGKNLH